MAACSPDDLDDGIALTRGVADHVTGGDEDGQATFAFVSPAVGGRQNGAIEPALVDARGCRGLPLDAEGGREVDGSVDQLVARV